MGLRDWSLKKRGYFAFYLKIKKFIINFINTYVHLGTFFRYGHWYFFSDINIEINTSCNRRCSYCPNSISERGLIENEKLMDIDVYKKLIDELAEIGFKGRISPHHFGEPLMNKKLTALMEYTRKTLPKVKLVIFSNGDALSIKRFDELINAGVDKFVITQHGESMSVNMIVLFNYLKEFPNKAKHIKYKHFDSTTSLSNRGGTIKPEILNTIPGCRYPTNPVSIDYNGNVLLCSNDYFSSVKFGNIRDQMFLDIWFSDRYRAVRKQLREKQYSLPICLKCIGKVKK